MEMISLPAIMKSMGSVMEMELLCQKSVHPGP